MERSLVLSLVFLWVFVTPAHAINFGAVQRHGAHQPALRALDDIVLRDLRTLMQSYERGNQSGVTQLLAGNYTSRDSLGFGFNTARLGLSVQADMRNLRSLDFDMDTAVPQYSADLMLARVDVRWNRRARFASSAEEWVTRNQRSTLLFHLTRQQALLASIQGDPLIGITSPVGVLIVDRGTVDGKAVGQPRTVLNGRLGAGAQDARAFGGTRLR